jgi:[ribosomal protein S5]-alanine N-acetyltransferase
MICESERLLLRRAQPEDAAFMLLLLNQPSWIRGIGDRGVRTLADAERYIDARMTEPFRTMGYGMNVVELKGTHAPIGLCGLVKRDTLAYPDLGFALLDDYAGQGYAQEAAQAVIAHARGALKISKLLAITAPGNERSGKLLGTLDFTLEQRARLTPDGEELNIYALDLS